MTTPAAAAFYEAQHVANWGGRPAVVFNPHNKPLAELPVIYGFNDGGRHGWMSAVAISEDGKVLGRRVCASEAYMPHDLGVIEGARTDLHENHYQRYYPEGYRMEFVPYDEFSGHKKLQRALDIANENRAGEVDQASK